MSEDTIERIWRKLDAIETKIDSQFNHIETRISLHGERITRSETTYTNLKWILGLSLSGISVLLVILGIAKVL